MTKTCTICREDKPTSEFYMTSKFRRKGFSSYCKLCSTGVSKRYRTKNSDKVKSRHLERKYNISLEEHTIMLEAQAGLCLICKLAPAACVDHDHTTNQIRGLLCHNCNKALGLFRDNAAVLARAVSYLEGPCVI